MPKFRKADGIIVSVTNYRWIPGTTKIRNELSDKDYNLFIVYMAEQLEYELKRAITRQRYKRNIKRWPPLSISYMQYKKRNKLSTNIWEATGHLKKQIKTFRRGKWLVVGFKRTDTYPNTNLQVNKVARYVEYGGVRLPPRPLFREVTVHMRKHVDNYYKKFRKEVLKS